MPIPGDLEFHPGLGPTIVGLARDAPRYGPGAWPLTLVAHYVVPLTNYLHVLCFKAWDCRNGIGAKEVAP